MNNNNLQIVLMIGLTKESSHWDPDFVNNVKKAFGTHDLLLLDLPGSGSRLNEKSPLTIKEIVESTREYYQDRLNNDKEKILISISMGGMVGSKWCHLFPNDFSYFVIMNSSFKNLSPVHKRVQPGAMKEFLKIFTTKDHEKREEKIIKLCSNNESKHAQTLKTWVKLAEEKAMTQENMLRQTIAAARFSMDFKLKNKVLIIVALYDKLAHFTCSQKIRDFWEADYQEIDSPDVGHAIHIDASSQAPEIIHKWYMKQSV